MTFSFNDVMLLAARYFYTNKIVNSVEKSLERVEVSAQSPKTAKQVHHPCRVSVTKIKNHSLWNIHWHYLFAGLMRQNWLGEWQFTAPHCTGHKSVVVMQAKISPSWNEWLNADL